MTQLISPGSEPLDQKIGRYTRNLLPATILLVIFISGWEIATHVFDIHKVILPAPSQILRVIYEERVLLMDDMFFTLQEVLLGFAIGFIAGLVLAIMIVYSPMLERSIYPLVVASQTIPVFAIAPLLVIWFGFGIWPKVLIAALIVFFPICVSEIEGLRSAEPEMIDLLRSLSASRWKIFRLVEFPASIPYLMAGTQIGITYSTIGAVIGEWVGSNKGIGELMLAGNAMLRTDLVFAAIVVLSVVTLALFISVSIISRLMMPWKYLKS
jgi:ABC-type nitrate/sulfonate/bicarbonate transport system permease component